MLTRAIPVAVPVPVDPAIQPAKTGYCNVDGIGLARSDASPKSNAIFIIKLGCVVACPITIGRTVDFRVGRYISEIEQSAGAQDHVPSAIALPTRRIRQRRIAKIDVRVDLHRSVCLCTESGSGTVQS